MDAVREYLGGTADGHESYSYTGSQWRLKITRAADVVTIRNLLERHEWAPRKSRERPYPSGPLNDMGFVRAWLELHSSADVVRTGRKRMPTPRLRVYGSQPLMEELNRVVTAGMGLPPRKLQRVATGTGETWCLYYFGGSFRAVVDWLYAGIELFNPTTRNRFEKCYNLWTVYRWLQAPFSVIQRPQLFRRKLHVENPARGGTRKRHGGTTTPYGFRKGDYVEAVKAGRIIRGYISGFSEANKVVSVADYRWKRIGQFSVSKVRLLQRSSRLLIKHKPCVNI